MFDLADVTVEELKRGYRYDGKRREYLCLTCGKSFADGEIFELEGRWFAAERAAELHVKQDHAGEAGWLFSPDNKYLNLTDVQRRLMLLLLEGAGDREIAERTGVTASTVRHQRFMFREKAKRAKTFLAAYELIFGGDDALPVSNTANMVNERFIVTKEERERALAAAFATLDPPVLLHFPVKEKKKVVILTELAKLFEPGTSYTEKEVNGVLQPVYADYVTLRRYLIEYGFLGRTASGSEYWRR